MAQIYLDEDVANLASGLRELGHDVVSVAEDALRLSRTDAWHFREALQQRRTLVTWNRRDFQYLHRLWTTLNVLRVNDASHAGILTADAAGSYERAEWIPTVHRKLESSDPLIARMWVWLQKADAWQEDRITPDED